MVRSVVYDQFYKSNGYGMMEVVNRDCRKLLVRFVDSGHEVWADAGNVLVGKVRDWSVPRANAHDWEVWDEDFTNNAGFSGKIISKKSINCIVKFHDTGYTTQAHIHNVRQGKISDPYSKTFLGIGHLGEFEKVAYWKPAKQLWSNMMKRCYNPKDKQGYYGTAFVSDSWKCFSNFLDDLPLLDNFEMWLAGKDGGSPYNLDKDLKYVGNKTYSKDTCMFVTEYLNKSAGAVNARKLDSLNGRYSVGE